MMGAFTYKVIVEAHTEATTKVTSPVTKLIDLVIEYLVFFYFSSKPIIWARAIREINRIIFFIEKD